MRYIFVDTNFLIHYQPIDEIDWSEIFEEEAFTFLIPYTVIQELDDHKYSEKAFLQKRSRKIISRLKRINSGKEKLPKKLSIEILTNEVPTEIFSENELSRELPDDRILASILFFREENKNSNLAYVTGDFSASLRAKKFEIDVIELSESYLLPSTEPEETKRLKKLERENKRLKKTFPDVDLFFLNRKKFKSYSIHKPLVFGDDYIEKRMDEIRKKFPKRTVRSKHTPWDPVSGNPIELKRPLSKPLKKYNEEIEEFYEQFQKYLENKIAHLILKRRSIEIKLMICNNGTTPAEDIDIWLHFPNGFEILNKMPFDNLSKPSPPSSDYKSAFNMSDIHGIAGLNFSHFDPPSNVGGISIKKTNSYEVETSVLKIKHNQCEELDSIIILFMPDEEVKGFTIDYRIDVGNYPDRIEGQLNVKLEEI